MDLRFDGFPFLTVLAPPRSVPKPSTMTLVEESQHLEDNSQQLEDDLIDFVIEEKGKKEEINTDDSDCEILCYNNVVSTEGFTE